MRRLVIVVASGFALFVGVGIWPGVLDSANTEGVLGAADDFVVVGTGPQSQRRVGPYQPARSRRDYAKAVKVFGRPSSWGLNANLCVVRWRRLALDLEFRVEGNCRPPRLRGLGAWCSARMYSRRWRTEEGLRVGDSERRLHSLYRWAKLFDAPPNPPTWFLTSDRKLAAEAWGGTVVALRLWGTCV